MDKHPDKYFSEKLSKYRKEPPSGAWDRIDANLVRANPHRVWLKVAVSVLILVMAGLVFFTLNSKSGENVVIANQEESKSITSDNSSFQKSEPIEQFPLQETDPDEVAIKSKAITNIPTQPKPEPFSEIKIENVPAETYSDVVDQAAPESKMVEPTVDAHAVADQKLPSRLITYSAQEVNKKYLRLKKKEAVVYTEPAKEKTTIGEIAVAFKNSHVGIGDLRQLKNDLFSLELFAQNDKTKTQ